ncbi:MAG: conjugal transfer protein TraF [Elusimicrobia bacterium]|nr:conjugal transfer protein TraF [Candidatus Obscuribacterium magneticum]
MNNLWQAVKAMGRPALAIIVMPAKAGIQVVNLMFKKSWIPAFAGMTTWVVVFVIFFQTCHQYRVFAAFDDMGRGARAPGMADTFVAVSDDANALYYNPAGLAQLGEAAVSTEYSQLLRGADDGSTMGTTYLGYAYPFLRYDKGTLGLSYHNFKADNLFNERTLSLSYGWKLKVEPFGWEGTWLAGFTLKQLHLQYQPDRFTENALNDAGVASGRKDPLFANGYSHDSYGFDAGFLYRFGNQYRYSAGLTIMNVNRPDVSFGHDGDRAPLITKFGLAYRPVWGVMSVEVRRTRRLAQDPDTDLALGTERTFRFPGHGALTFRGGYAEGSREFKAATAGASYQFGNVEFDYSFNIPIGNLSDFQGSHKVGFTFRLGVSDKKGKESVADYDLLESFERDSRASYVLITRQDKAGELNDYLRMKLLQILIRKYPVDDPGLKGVKKDLSALLIEFKSQLSAWPDLKAALVAKIKPEERREVEDSLEFTLTGDEKLSMAKLTLLSSLTREDSVVRALNLINLGALAAQYYRKSNLDLCIDQVREMMVILPKDEVIEKAYRELLQKRFESERKMYPADNGKLLLPEAPQTLTAPKTEKPSVTASEALAKEFNAALGYYFKRKADGAPLAERTQLLKKMVETYGNKGLDLTLVTRELAEIEKALKQKAPTPKPAAKPWLKVEPKQKKLKTEIKKASPAQKPMNRELQESWSFYRQAVQRGITDRERIEILNSILLKFGEKEAPDVNKELERIRKRAEKNE